MPGAPEEHGQLIAIFLQDKEQSVIHQEVSIDCYYSNKSKVTRKVTDTN